MVVNKFSKLLIVKSLSVADLAEMRAEDTLSMTGSEETASLAQELNHYLQNVQKQI